MKNNTTQNNVYHVLIGDFYFISLILSPFDTGVYKYNIFKYFYKLHSIIVNKHHCTWLSLL